MVDKLHNYYHESAFPIPVFRAANGYTWNSDKIFPFPHVDGIRPLYLEYVRHAQPINTFRLFTPWPGR